MRMLIEIFDAQYRAVDERTRTLAGLIPDDKLFWQPPGFETYSCGEYLLRSAAAVEQTFGGLTVRLWDDPFEWTLPEELATREKVLDYLEVVESTRQKGFAYLVSDADLSKQVPAPEELTSIFDLLLRTLARSAHLQGRAFAVFQMFSSDKLPAV